MLEGIFLGTMCGAFFLLPLLIWILIGVYMYKDAEKRGKSGVLWLLIGLVLGIIGLIIWLIVRPPLQPQSPPPQPPPQ